jgi:hypothetical protein
VSLEAFEHDLMSALLAGDDPLLEALRAQYAAATVKDREIAPSGFVAHFDVPSSAVPIPNRFLHLDDLQVDLEGARTPAEASVEVKNGRLRELRCYVYDGDFPAVPVITAAWYYGTKKYPGITPELMAKRDVDELLEDDE